MWFLALLAYGVLTIALLAFSLANLGQTVPQVVLWQWGGQAVLENVSFVHAVLTAFFAGALLVMVTRLGRDLSERHHLRRLEQDRRRLEQELAAIRHLPLEEPLPRAVERHARD